MSEVIVCVGSQAVRFEEPTYIKLIVDGIEYRLVPRSNGWVEITARGEIVTNAIAREMLLVRVLPDKDGQR